MSKDASIDMLKALAIIAVVGIHVMAYVEQIDAKRLLWENYITLDQVFRFCVPLFVALSGYTLAKSYGDKKIDWVRFAWKRIKRTIPLYLLWSGIFIVTWRLVPQWSTFSANAKWWEILIYGKADYHLYFVPMILCLYALFPLLLILIKRFKFAFVALLFIAEALFYYWISAHLDLSWRVVKPFYSDQEQYIFFGSWIFFFCLGIYLHFASSWGRKIFRILSPILVLFDLWWAGTNAVNLYRNGVDVLSASRFTRLPILIYSTGVIGLGLEFRSYLVKLPALIKSLLVFLGRQSYWIYLGHTLWLRVFFSYLNRDVTTSALIIPMVIGLFAVAASVAFERSY